MPTDVMHLAGAPLAPEDVRHRRLLLLMSVVGVGMLASIAFHLMMSALGFVYPYDTFFFRPDDRFMDFFNDIRYVRAFVPGGSDVVTYTPFAHLVMRALALPPERVSWVASVMLFAGNAVAASWVVVREELTGGLTGRFAAVMALGLLTYPMLWAVDRSNQVMFVFCLLFWFAYLYFVRGKRWAVGLLAAAIAWKVYPAVLLPLLLAERRWRDAALAAGGGLLLLAGATVGLGAWSGYGAAGVVAATAKTLGQGHAGYAASADAIQHGHSLWGILMVVLLRARNVFDPGMMFEARAPYMAIALTLFALVSIYVVFFERALWRRAALLTFCGLLLPYSSHDYNLVLVYIPLALFVLTAPEEPGDELATILFGLLLIPIDYLVISYDITISIVAYPAIMLAMCALIVWRGVAARRASPAGVVA